MTDDMPHEPGAPPDGFERELREWLRDAAGVEEPRRVARVAEGEVLLSKFEPGFAARLHDLLDRVPELFDSATVAANYDVTARALPADTPRVDAWHASMHAALAAAGARMDIEDVRLAEVRTGIDSVRAVLEAVLWSGPAVGDDYAPRSGEVEAYRDGLAALADERDIFTRYYGEFDGRAVRNHCPGAAFARRMLSQGWRAITATPPPG
ncbi:MAG: hypothetical protein WD058_08455 [Dehalococcoidia bacterium]